MNIKAKIQKLLALSASPEEGEAQAALLKARELMAKYKIAEHELDELKSTKVETRHTNVYYTPEKGVWKLRLADVIFNNFCCKTILSKTYGKKSCQIWIVGFPQDIEIALHTYQYAIQFVEYQSIELKKIIKRRYPELDWRKVEIYINTYAISFCDGLKLAFDSQDTSDWGLVPIVPKEVDETIESLRSSVKKVCTNMYSNELSNSFKEQGYTDGLNYRHKEALHD